MQCKTKSSDKSIVSLYHLPVKKKGIVAYIEALGATRRRMLDLGVIPGAPIEVLRVSPLGDPKAYKIRGAVIAFRKEESTKIFVHYCKED